MPIAHIHLMEGRDDAQKEALIAAVTDAIVASLGVPQDTVRVLLQELPKQHFGIAGQSAKARGR
ncbi:2-hydroxymuconate tautomerase [Isoalcanivorax beigongshangi]|uniref:Tautomerase n=1 Tax=Isoalcanivorax beigongshangi TaxID=3238810 RepID=A0ABV4ADW9_9GAMM